MSSPFKTKEFKALQEKWEAKLEAEGLGDLDDKNGSLKNISHGDRFAAEYNPARFQAKEEYFRRAGYFLYEHEFKTNLERKIWELHIEGISIREMVKILKKQRFKVYKRKVHELLMPMVEKLLQKMKAE